MNLELYETYKTKFWNLNMKVSMFVLAFALIVLLLRNFLEGKILNYVGLTLFGLFILSQLVELKSFFSIYESKKGEKGNLEFNKNGIKWNGKKIDWNSIKVFEIEYNEINNNHKWDIGPKNNISDGLNRIKIQTKNSQNFNGHYQLKSENEKHILTKLLRECVFTNQLKYELAKNIIQPKNYKEHQLLKQQIKENTDNKR